MTGLTLALSLFVTSAAGAQVEPQGRPESDPVSIGMISTPDEQTPLGREFLRLMGAALAAAHPGTGWLELATTLGEAPAVSEPGDGDREENSARAWVLASGQTGGITPEPRGVVAVLGDIRSSFEASVDINALRAVSAQPFSRSARGHILDAIGLDNARSARVAALPGSPDGADELTVVLFSESRAFEPGRWHAAPIAHVRLAAVRGATPARVPIEIEFGEQWDGAVLAAADLVLGLDTSLDAISTEERLGAWGLDRVASLRGVASGLEGRVWVWQPRPGGGAICALPLRRGASDRGIVTNLRSVFGAALVWRRAEGGPATGVLDIRSAAAGPEGVGISLAMRIVSISDRSMLVVAQDAEDLDTAAEMLAKLAH